MSRVTDVLVSIDTETILKNYPNISKNPAVADADRRQPCVHGDQSEQRGQWPGRWRT